MRYDRTNNQNRVTNQILEGEGISPGLAIGKAWVYEGTIRRTSRSSGIDRSEAQRQLKRIDRALEKVCQDLEQSARQVEEEVNKDLAAVFRAHHEILTSPTLQSELRESLENELVDAEEAVQRVFWRWERRFTSGQNSQTSRYADDMADLCRRLLHALAGIHAHPLESIPAGSVVVASRLLPSDTAHMSRASVVGVLAAQAGPGSHASLITSERGIPAVAQLPDLLADVSSGDTVLLDGDTGEVILRPDEATEADFRRRMCDQHASQAEVLERCKDIASTRDGIVVPVRANVGSREDVAMAVENGADGIGLFRLESLLMTSTELPSEQHLRTQLLDMLSPFKEKPITIRLLDAGGDKPVPWLDLPDEGNPFLGRRGLRLLLHHPELLESQLRTCLWLSKELDISILVPMVTLPEEMKEVRDLMQRIARTMGIEKLPPLGAMIETPAAALCADEIAANSDFLSIGTNDLTQYTMAADRETPSASHYFQDDHRAVLKLVKIACDLAGDTPVSVCGELAGRPAAVAQLLALGVRGLSVAPPVVPFVKQAVRDANMLASMPEPVYTHSPWTLLSEPHSFAATQNAGHP